MQAPQGPVAPAAPAPALPLPAEVPAAPAGNLLAARAVAGVLALGLLGLGVVLLSGSGFRPDLVGALGFVARALVAGALLVAALDPKGLARALRTPRLATGGGVVAFCLVVFALYFVFGLGTLVETAQELEQVAAGQNPNTVVGNVDRATLLLNLAINLAIFSIPVAAWAAAAEGQPGRRALAWLGLTGGSRRWSAAWALTAVLLVFWFLVAAGLATRAAGLGEPQNARADAIANSLDVPLALLVAAMTGIGEELFFRGFLLKKVGNLPQALLFGLAHLNYLQVLEVVVTAALGYGFGRTVQKTRSLWGPVLAHATFNAVSLLVIIGRNNGWLG